MRIGGVGMTPYIYNTNMVSSLSMNKISAIPDDATKGRTDFTGLVSDEAENENPLRKGQSKDFMGILTSQLSMSRYHQTKLMKEPAMADETAVKQTSVSEKPDEVQSNPDYMAIRMSQAITAYELNMGIA